MTEYGAWQFGEATTNPYRTVKRTMKAKSLRAGALLAALLITTACSADIATSPEKDPALEPIASVAILGLPDTLASGDVTSFGVRMLDKDGEPVINRTVTLSSSNTAVAIIDPSGRVRTIASGATTISASVEGRISSVALTVTALNTILPLRAYEGHSLPYKIFSDSVSWDGVAELHELYVEDGRLGLSGGSTPRYQTEIRVVEYNVVTDAQGHQTKSIRLAWYERDRGLVSYDARGDLSMTSEITWPLSHVASPDSKGMTMRYRIPGDDTTLQLGFERLR